VNPGPPSADPKAQPNSVMTVAGLENPAYAVLGAHAKRIALIAVIVIAFRILFLVIGHTLKMYYIHIS